MFLINAIKAISEYAVPAILVVIPLYGLIKNVSVYEVFAEGAAEGLKTAFRVMPYMLTMFFVIGIVRETGVMDIFVSLLAPGAKALGIPPEILPMGIMRSLSGSGAQAMLGDILNTYGADSPVGLAASVAMGSTETTLYCVTLYYGSISVKNSRYTIPLGLSADAISLILASALSRLIR